MVTGTPSRSRLVYCTWSLPIRLIKRWSEDSPTRPNENSTSWLPYVQDPVDVSYEGWSSCPQHQAPWQARQSKTAWPRKFLVGWRSLLFYFAECEMRWETGESSQFHLSRWPYIHVLFRTRVWTQRKGYGGPFVRHQMGQGKGWRQMSSHWGHRWDSRGLAGRQETVGYMIKCQYIAEKNNHVARGLTCRWCTVFLWPGMNEL